MTRARQQQPIAGDANLHREHPSVAIRAASTLLALIALLAGGCQTKSQATERDEHAVRRIVALLDYVAADYAGAVRDGVVLDDIEYREQLAFLKEARDRIDLLPAGPREEARARTAEAEQLARSRAAAQAVGQATRNARAILVTGYHVQLGPSLSPSLERARVLFAQSCATCHGASGGGDGPGAAALRPPPRSFRDPETIRMLSPVRAFSALTDGVPGTAMVAFTALPDQDRWSLAFYIMTLRHNAAVAERGRTIVDSNPQLAGLDFAQLADLRDLDLEERIHTSTIADKDREPALAFLRLTAAYQPRGSVAEIRRSLLAAKTAFANGDAAAAKRSLTDAYLDGFEPLEARLLVGDPALVRRIEDQFLALREGAEHDMPVARFESDVDTLLVQLEAIDARLRGETSPWSAALAAFVVVVREAVESVLLVMLLLGLAKRAGFPGDRKAVHAGWASAIGAGLVTWFASAAVVALGGGNRELVEGVVALIAVGVLLYAGHFVLARMDAQRRIAALKRRFASISSGRRRLLLYSFSFIAAYREAFEVVLFLRAILLGSPGAGAHLALGAALGLTTCVAAFWIASRVGRRVNATALMNIGGGLLCVLAFVLAGKGVRSLQEAGVVGVSAFEGPRSDLLGIFPTIQTIVAQLVVIGVIILVAVVVPRMRRELINTPSETKQ